MTAWFLDTLDVGPALDAAVFCDCLGYESVFLPPPPLPSWLYVMEIRGRICVPR